ncbi:MAG: ATP-dependent helicase [bacterium]
MDLKKIHQMLRERRSTKLTDQPVSSPDADASNLPEEQSAEPVIRNHVIFEDYNDILEEIKSRNSILYESMKKLNQNQMEAIFTNNKKTLVSAMVGSGKTTVLVHKVLYLHFIKDVPLNDMAVLTFTNRAANEIKERITTFYMQDNALDNPDLSLFGTFHAVARSVLLSSPILSDLGYTPRFTIMDENERQVFYLRIADELGLNIKYRNKVEKRIERYSQESTRPREGGTLYGNMKYEDDLKELIRLGQERKKRSNVMDYDDLIENVNLVLSHPNNNFHPKWIIVDEFQDCSPEQIKMIMNMAGGETSIFAVGDPNQLIYAWRGSDLSIFYDFRANECKEHHLPVNYRSTTKILDVAKYFISYDVKELNGTREAGVPVSLVNHYDSNQEAIYLATNIKSLNNEGIPFREIAILFRTRQQLKIFETVFQKEGIPFEVASRRTLQDVPPLHWLTKLLKACLNKQDINCIYDAICHETYGIVESSKVRLQEYQISSDESKKITELEKFTEWLSRNICKDENLLTFPVKMLNFESWLENKGYADIPSIFDYFDLATYLKPTSIHYPKDVELVKLYLEEISKYAQLSQDADMKSSLLAALSDMSLGGHQIIAETIDPNSERVKLLTMHSAKGLEFRYVFISGANNGLIPLRHSAMDSEELEEEKRLFFVAITRAKDYLEISYHTNPEGWNSYPEPSMFIGYIPQNLLKSKQTRSLVVEEVECDEKNIDRIGQWSLGQRIGHTKYGIGTICRISKANIVCNFEKFGEKSFSINFLPIVPFVGNE